MKDLQHETVSFLFCFHSATESVIKLKSLATIRDIVLFAVSRCCDHYVTVILHCNTSTYSQSPVSPASSLSTVNSLGQGIEDKPSFKEIHHLLPGITVIAEGTR